MSEIEKQCQILLDQLKDGHARPSKEDLLQVLLQDPGLSDAVKNVVLSDPQSITLARTRFNLALQDWAKQKLNIEFMPNKEATDVILYFCIGVMRAVDDMSAQTKLSDDPLNYLRKLYEFDMHFTRPCQTLFTKMVAGEEYAVLYQTALVVLREKHPESFSRIFIDIYNVQTQLFGLQISESLESVVDQYYCGREIVSRFQQKLLMFCSALKLVDPQFENIHGKLPAKISDVAMVEAIYYLMLKQEPDVRQNEMIRYNARLQMLISYIKQANADLTNRDFLGNLHWLRSTCPYTILRMLSDQSVPLQEDGLALFDSELKDRVNFNSQALAGPEEADLRTAKNMLEHLLKNLQNDAYRPYLLIALECFLFNSTDLAESLERNLRKSKEVPEDVSTLFIRVQLSNKMMPVLNDLLLDEDLEDSARVKEIRMLLVRANLAPKQKLKMIVAVAKQYTVVNNLFVSIATLGLIRRRERSAIFQILQELDVNNLDLLRTSLDKLCEFNSIKKAISVVDKNGVIGQLETIETFIKSQTLEIHKLPAALHEKDLTKKLDAIEVMQQMLSHVEAALIQAEYFSEYTVQPARQKSSEFCTDLQNLQVDTKLQLMRVKIHHFQMKYQEMEEKTPEFVSDLETLRAAYYADLPVKEKMPKINKAFYDQAIDDMALLIENFNDLERNLPQGLGFR